MNTLTQCELRSAIDYEPNSGLFFRKKTGVIAGCIDKSNGYKKIQVKGTIYRAHRLAWLYVYGEFPEINLDHINGDRSDNRISNLRMATALENAQNRKTHSNNKSGFAGVSFHKSSGLWRSQLAVDGVKKYVGYFKCIEQAKSAYKSAKSKYHAFSPSLREGATA